MSGAGNIDDLTSAISAAESASAMRFDRLAAFRAKVVSFGRNGKMRGAAAFVR